MGNSSAYYEDVGLYGNERGALRVSVSTTVWCGWKYSIVLLLSSRLLFCESLFKVTQSLVDLVLKEKFKCRRKFSSYIIGKEKKGESVNSFG